MQTILLIAGKELRIALRTPRFVLAILVIIPLFTGVVAIGCNKFNLQQSAYNATLQQEAEGFHSIKDYWRMLRSFLTSFRPTNPRAILASGISAELEDTFFMYNVNNPPNQRSLLVRNSFSLLHGRWDMVKIISLIFSFLAILISYDALAGEKRNGTVRLLYAAPVSRISITLGKVLGLTATLAIIISVAAVLSALIVSFSLPDHSASLIPELFALTAFGILYSMLFVSIAVAISAMCHQPFNSLAMSLAIWIILILIIPQLAVFAASSAHPAMSEKEIGDRSEKVVGEYLAGFRAVARGETPEEKIRFRQHWFAITRTYQEGLRNLWQEDSNRLLLQEKTATDLSWLSPAFAISLSASGLCNTSPSAEVAMNADVWNVVIRYVDYLEERVIPDLEEMYKTGNPLRQYANGIDWESVPKVVYREMNPDRRWFALLNGSLILIAWFAIFLIIAILFARRYDPR